MYAQTPARIAEVLNFFMIIKLDQVINFHNLLVFLSSISQFYFIGNTVAKINN